MLISARAPTIAIVLPPRVQRVTGAVRDRPRGQPKDHPPEPPPAVDDEQQAEEQAEPDKQPRRDPVFAPAGGAEPRGVGQFILRSIMARRGHVALHCSM